MSSTLIIRHLSADLSVEERQDFLKHFGAQKVWFINTNSHSAFASFETESAAEIALTRLHQLELLGRRLTVEYANDSICPPIDNYVEKTENNCLRQFIDHLNSWNPSVDLLQPPPPNLNYKYPLASPKILFNIMHALQKNVSFYVQTLHLMNKMGLDPPFHNVKEGVVSYIKDSLHVLDIKLHELYSQKTESKGVQVSSSEEESEISSADETSTLTEVYSQLPKKRKSNLKRINKKPRLAMQIKINHSDRKKSQIYNTKDIFEETSIQETKKIEVKVSKIPLIAGSVPDNLVEVVGTIGKINPPKQNIEENNSKNINDFESNEDRKPGKGEATFITAKELLENKISLKDMKSLPIFKSYHPGIPSMRIYIKNLSKDVNTADIERIYKRYITECDFSEAELFNVRVMQEGRMKGQAFVTFPSIELSQTAVNETNGYILKNKPMVVQFARTAK